MNDSPTHEINDRSWAIRRFERELQESLENHPQLPNLRWNLGAGVGLGSGGPQGEICVDRPNAVWARFGFFDGCLDEGGQHGHYYWWPNEVNPNDTHYTLPDGWETFEGDWPLDWDSIADHFAFMFFRVRLQWEAEAKYALVDHLMIQAYTASLTLPDVTDPPGRFADAGDRSRYMHFALDLVRLSRSSIQRKAGALLLAGPEFRPFGEMLEVADLFVESPDAPLGAWDSAIEVDLGLQLLADGFSGTASQLSGLVKGSVGDLDGEPEPESQAGAER